MRKFAVSVLFLCLVAGIAYAKDYNGSKKVGPYEVRVSLDHTPAVIGVNNVTIEVREGTGPANGVDPALYYYMPSMPAMHYSARAAGRSGVYTAVIKPTMPGKWIMKVKVKVKGPDERTYALPFEFEVK